MLKLIRFFGLLTVLIAFNFLTGDLHSEGLDAVDENLIERMENWTPDFSDGDPLSINLRDLLQPNISIQYILYVRPGGDLGNQLRQFWNNVKIRRLDNPAVLDYPPHCSLTGFFPGSISQEDEYILALRQALKNMEPISIQITSKKVQQGPKLDYIPLASPDLLAITTKFVELIGISTKYIKAQPGTFGYHISLREDTKAKTTASVRKLEDKYIDLAASGLSKKTTWALYIYRKMNNQLKEVVRIPIETN